MHTHIEWFFCKWCCCAQHVYSGGGGETHKCWPLFWSWEMVWHLPKSVKTSNALAAFFPLTDIFPSIFLSFHLSFLYFSLFLFFFLSFFPSFFFLPQCLALPNHLPNSKTPNFQSLYLWTTPSHAQIKSFPSFGVCRSWAWSVKVQTLSDQPFPW